MSAPKYGNRYLREYGLALRSLFRILQLFFMSPDICYVSLDSLHAGAIVILLNHDPNPFSVKLRQWHNVVVNVRDVAFVCIKKLKCRPFVTEQYSKCEI